MKGRNHGLSAVLLVILGILWSVPLLAVACGAIRASAQNPTLPHGLDPGIVRTLAISVLVCTVASVLSTTFGTMAGYAISQKRFYGKKLLFGALVGAMFFPPVVFMAPLFKIVASLRIYDTLAALILPSAATAFSVVYMKVVIDRVPSSTLDAAKIDGVGEIAILTRIILPLVRGPLAALLVLQFLATWGALAVPMAVVHSPRNYTLTLRLAMAIQRLYRVPERDLLWTIGLIAIPAIVLFFLKARDLIVGVMSALFRYEPVDGDMPY